MKIQMRTTAAGPKGVLHADGVYEVADKQAKELIDGGYAVPASEGVHPVEADADDAEEAESKPAEKPSRRK